MPNTHHVTEFAGLPVVEFPGYDTVDDVYQNMVRRGIPIPDPYPPHAALEAALADPGSVAWRLRRDEPRDVPPYRPGRFFQDQPLEGTASYTARFAEEVDLSAVTALTVGNMPDEDHGTEVEKAAEALLGLAPRLTGLRSLFFGEVVQEENEISWINLCDLAPLVTALPNLEELVVRGGSGDLSLHIREHRSLRSLTVQSGALRPEVVRDVCASGLPVLEHLELWLGAEEYGGETTPEDLGPVLSGKAFPELCSLGVRNTEGIDDWIPVLAQAPVLPSLEVLDLSLGDLTDEGAQALIEAAPAFRGLRRLDLHHHFLSEDMRERVRAALPGVEVDLSGPREPNTYGGEVHYYTAVAE
ncbi:MULTISPECIES: STM4015 family protein [Nocardiopsis]|uniref:Cytoplasmic protein n=1 Tax=Nocardiopsis sinuspersici TaxID=501010 RepID=A0A1V3C515_9ACTN|nr:MULTISPECIES: STM4015 family protein [Nocardiopsis]OOC55626.1 hypothetical protein NOSIN_18835 [Nocardiopsis sinuspersici]